MTSIMLAPSDSHCPQQVKANLHPGRIVLKTQIQQKTPAKKTADDLHIQELADTQATAVQQSHTQVSNMEATMEVRQATQDATKVKPVRLRQVPTSQGRLTDVPVLPHVEVAGMEVEAHQETGPAVVMDTRQVPTHNTTGAKLIRQRWEPQFQGRHTSTSVQACVENTENVSKVDVEVETHQGPVVVDHTSSQLWSGGTASCMLRRQGAMYLLVDAPAREVMCKDDPLDNHVHHWIKTVPATRVMAIRSKSKRSCPSIPSLTTNATTASSVSLKGPAHNRTFQGDQMPVPAHYMDEEVDQLSFHVKAIVASTVNNVESDEVFDWPIYEEVLAGSKHKHSDHDNVDYVTSSKVEDFDDGDVEVDDSNMNFGVQPAKESCVTRMVHSLVNNGIKKLKVKKDAGQESEEKNTTAGQVFSTGTNGTGKCHYTKNRDLPSELTEEKLWARQIMPALLLWAGNDNLMRVLQMIILTIVPSFKDKQNDIWPGMAIFTIANQCLCTWHNNFTSKGINIIAHYLVSNPEIGGPSSANVKKMCSALLKDFTFIYLDQDMSKLMNAFWSHFILFLLSHTHLCPCAGCPDIPQLKTKDFKKKGHQRCDSHCLFGGKLQLDTMSMYGRAVVKLPIKLNPASGKESTTMPKFSEGATAFTSLALESLSEDGSNEDSMGDVDKAIDALHANLCKSSYCLCTCH
ncbi:hypothetical protein EDC04DRAFT_2607163 [Pisolithus marmoratus]|nr:hypothetical protein EDC04DRAFT_2607163 [Pisolithus marmoratus]